MSDEEETMLSLPGRLNTLEQQVHTLQYRMDSSDQERLPHRVATLEKSVKDLSKMQTVVTEIRDGVNEHKAYLRSTRFWGCVLMAVLTLIIAVAGLAPKLDAVILKPEPIIAEQTQ